MKKQTITTIAGILLVIFIIIFKYPTPLEKFCKPNPDFKNIYGLTDREFLAFSLSDKISNNLQFKESTKEKTLSEILETRIGDCDEHSLILQKCLSLYGFDSFINKVHYCPPKEFFSLPFCPEDFHHSFITLTINGKDRVLDPTLSDDKSLYLFNDHYLFSYWEAEIINKVINSENVSNE